MNEAATTPSKRLKTSFHYEPTSSSSANNNNGDSTFNDLDESNFQNETNQIASSNGMANDEAWVLTQSQSGGHKCYSMGFAYTIDKPKQSDVEKATKIYWRCEKYRYLKCTGRAVSAGLRPPLKITIGHNHPMEPERKEFRQYRLPVKSNVSSQQTNGDADTTRRGDVNGEIVENVDGMNNDEYHQHETNLNELMFHQDEFFMGKQRNKLEF